MARIEFNGSNIWHWLVVILVACLVAYVIYWLVTILFANSALDKFQDTNLQLAEPVLYKSFKKLAADISQTSLTAGRGFSAHNVLLNDNTDNTLKYLLASARGANNSELTANFFKCIKYFDIFEIARISEWKAANSDPKIVAIENTGFTSFRPSPVIVEQNGIKYSSLGDLYIPNGNPNLNNLIKNDTIKGISGYDGYIRYNIAYLSSATIRDNSDAFWSDDGTGGEDNCMISASNFGAMLSKNSNKWKFYGDTSINLKTSPNRTPISADARNTIYKINTSLFDTLAKITFQGPDDFPTLNTKPTYPCEMHIRINDKYISISTINENTKTYALKFTTDKSAANKFYITDNIIGDKKKVVILTRINSALPEGTCDYVMGVDAINCDSLNSDHIPFSSVRLYPLSSSVIINSTDTQIIKPSELSYGATRNPLNKLRLYHNAGYPFYQFDLAANNTMSLDSIAGDTLKQSQKFLFTGTDLRFCSNTGTNPAFAYDLVNTLPNVTDDTTDSNIGPLFTVDVTIGNKKASSNTNIVYLRDITDSEVNVTYTMLIVYAPTDTANNGKYLNITKSADGKPYTLSVTDQPFYFTLSEDRKQILTKLAKDSKGCVQITTFAPDKVELMPYVDPITTSEYSQELLTGRILKLRPVGIVDTYMYLNNESPPKIVYAKPVPGTKPVGESGSPKITVYGTQTGNPDNVVLYIPPTGAQTSIRYIYYMSSSGSSQASTVLNTTTQFADLNIENTQSNTGPLRQYFTNPGRFRLIPKEGSQPLVYSVSVYMSNGEYLPLQDIELVDVTPPETKAETTPETKAETTPETKAETTPETKAENTKSTKANNTKANNDYVPSSTPAPTEQPTTTEETTTTTTTFYNEISRLDARIAQSGGVN